MMRHTDIPAEVERSATQVLDAAVEVHRALGPGLRETVYRHCLVLELRRTGACVDEEVAVDLF